MYGNISKMVIDCSLRMGWNSKETQKDLYLAVNTVVWFFLAGVLGGLVQLFTGSRSVLDVTALALFGALLPGFYGGILYLYHTAVEEE